MRPILSPAVVTGVALMLSAAPAIAHPPPDRHRAPVVEPASGGGLTGGELLARGWATPLTPDDPAVGHCATLAPDVISPRPVDDIATCRATTRTRVFVQFGSSCFNLEVPPGTGDPDDEAVQLACARAFDATVETVRLVVDGRPINTKTPRYELVSPQLHLVMPPGNFYGLDPGTEVSFTAHGWGAVVRDMRPGVHTVREIATFTDTDDVFDVTAVIHVQPSR